MLIDIKHHDQVCIVHCEGRLVAGPEIEYMQAKMDDIRRLECSTMLADFQDVTCIGSMGVTFIVDIYTSVVRKPGGRFVLTGALPAVERVLELTGLGNLIPQASDLASGLEFLQAEAAVRSMAVAR
ncbi:MAG: STAS domain-containing protein [Bryobacterales bacterium]|nr:STAS domain-containing protein [Bryobacterales bacterium]